MSSRRSERRREATGPLLHPSGARSGDRAWNGAEMATAGITDSAPWGPLTDEDRTGCPRGDRLRGTPGLPRASPPLRTQQFRRTQRTRRWPQRPPPGPAFPLPRPGEPAQKPRWLHPHPRTQHPPPHWPLPVPSGGSPKKGVRPRNPRSEGRSQDSDSSPQPVGKGTRESGLLPTHLPCGPVFGSGSSDVRVAATWSPRLPRAIPPAAAQQRLVTAHARAAVGGEKPAARGECRAHLHRGAQRPQSGAAGRGRRSRAHLPDHSPRRRSRPIVPWIRLRSWPGIPPYPYRYPSEDFSLPQSACPLQTVRFCFLMHIIRS